VVATACASSAKAFGVAARYLAAGLCDAAVVGGVDCLCLTTLYGFNALELIAREPCRPWDAERAGISIGEAAGFALVERMPSERARWRLLGYGESSDAHHMSSPPPDGAGAARAMRAALAGAGLEPAAVDYVNLHGTGTHSNDLAEDAAVQSVLGRTTPCSSTKGFTGHALGAAGIVEALLACLALDAGLVPGTLHTRRLDPALGADVRLASEARPLRHAMSNSFGFGGGNCSLLLGRAAA
jgi:3-oxoacyl-[acyl-carrier-protein] synthase-1